jgi:hypothetical protein
VTNGIEAVQSIWRFFVEVKSSSFNPTAPTDWHSSILKRDSIMAVAWSSEDSSADVTPSKTLIGFKISSLGIPAIVGFYARGYLEPPEGETEYQKGSKDVLVNSVHGITLGPSDPPNPFSPLVFLDTLISYKHQSVTLGWLTSHRDDDCDDDERSEDGIIKNLDKRLEKAKKALIQRDSVKARRELEKFVKKVERIWKRSQDEDKKRGRDRDGDRAGSVMTGEAYALLKYNAEYLIERLPEKQKPEPGKQTGKPKEKERE